MKVKTYGVPGLSEWYSKLRVGTIETEVSFVGGTVAPSGAQPASMTTKDPIVQFIVENSREYKEGFIILLQQQETQGVHPREAQSKGRVSATVLQPTEPQKTDVSVGESATEADGFAEVEVADRKEAVEWLKAKYPDAGYNGNNLRSTAAFDAACASAKVKFIYPD